MNNPTNTHRRRRKRGVTLTEAGLARFQAAKVNSEFTQNQGQRYTLEALSERTGVGVDTLTKVLGCEMRVDKQTLKCCFRAFDLELGPDDYYSSESMLSGPSFAPSDGDSCLPPGGQLPLNSAFYIERHQAELDSFNAINKPGALVRIKGARQTGKTSLMARIAQRALQHGYHPITISYQLADKQVVQDLDQLLQWFCASVSLKLGVSASLDAYWDSLFGSKVSCNLYFEQYLLPQTERPVVLILDDVERLFCYPEIADEFFGLLRTWYEEAKTANIWQQLRIVMAQNSEVYIPLNLNKSPFNVGLAVPLPPFTPAQVQALAKVYGLGWSSQVAEQLCQLVEGQPYLVHLAIYHSWRGEISPADLLAEPLGCPPFSAYLQRQLREIQQRPELAKVLGRLLSEETLSSSALPDVYQLQGMGLVALKDEGPQVTCDLFRAYFLNHLSLLSG